LYLPAGSSSRDWDGATLAVSKRVRSCAMV
jgi:hypothetical protein